MDHGDGVEAPAGEGAGDVVGVDRPAPGHLDDLGLAAQRLAHLGPARGKGAVDQAQDPRAADRGESDLEAQGGAAGGDQHLARGAEDPPQPRPERVVEGAKRGRAVGLDRPGERPAHVLRDVDRSGDEVADLFHEPRFARLLRQGCHGHAQAVAGATEERDPAATTGAAGGERAGRS